MGWDIVDIKRQLCTFVSRVNHRLAKCARKSELVEYIWTRAAELGDKKCGMPNLGKYRWDDPGVRVEMMIHPRGCEFFSLAHALKGLVSILQMSLFLKWHHHKHVRRQNCPFSQSEDFCRIRLHSGIGLICQNSIQKLIVFRRKSNDISPLKHR